MAHRHYGVRETKPATHRSQAPAGAWSGNAFIWAIVVIMVVLGVTLYGVSKTVTDAVKTTASAPRTTGQGSPAPTGAVGLRSNTHTGARARSFSCELRRAERQLATRAG
jgi:hypothetical protein